MMGGCSPIAAETLHYFMNVFIHDIRAYRSDRHCSTRSNFWGRMRKEGRRKRLQGLDREKQRDPLHQIA